MRRFVSAMSRTMEWYGGCVYLSGPLSKYGERASGRRVLNEVSSSGAVELLRSFKPCRCFARVVLAEVSQWRIGIILKYPECGFCGGLGIPEVHLTSVSSLCLLFSLTFTLRLFSHVMYVSS